MRNLAFATPHSRKPVNTGIHSSPNVNLAIMGLSGKFKDMDFSEAMGVLQTSGRSFLYANIVDYSGHFLVRNHWKVYFLFRADGIQ